MKQVAQLALATRLIAKNGSLVQWTRRFLSPATADGVVTEPQEPVVAYVSAVQTDAYVARVTPPSWWASATIVLLVSASALPFDVDPQAGGSPSVDWLDVVEWGGRTFRVVGMTGWWATQPGKSPKPNVLFVGLGA